MFVKPLHKNSDIVRYGAKTSDKKLLYIPTGLNISNYPNLESYLSEHKDRLASRAQIVRSRQPWFQLLWPRDPETFVARPKIVAPYRSRANAFFYTEDQFYGSTDTYFVLGDEALSLKSVLAFLNSSVGLVWFKNMGKVKGVMLDLTGDNLELFPVPIDSFTREVTSRLETLVDEMQTIVRDSENNEEVVQSQKYKELYSQIDQIVFACYSLTPEEKSIILEAAAALSQD